MKVGVLGLPFFFGREPIAGVVPLPGVVIRCLLLWMGLWPAIDSARPSYGVFMR